MPKRVGSRGDAGSLPVWKPAARVILAMASAMQSLSEDPMLDHRSMSLVWIW